MAIVIYFSLFVKPIFNEFMKLFFPQVPLLCKHCTKQNRNTKVRKCFTDCFTGKMYEQNVNIKYSSAYSSEKCANPAQKSFEKCAITA